MSKVYHLYDESSAKAFDRPGGGTGEGWEGGGRGGKEEGGEGRGGEGAKGCGGGDGIMMYPQTYSPFTKLAVD